MTSKSLIFAVLVLSACHSTRTDDRSPIVGQVVNSSTANRSSTTAAQLGPDLAHYELRALSPSGRYAVTVPKGEFVDQIADSKNQLITATTGTTLAQLPGWVGHNRMNHGGCDGTWSKDESLLVWIVDGKWSSDSVVVAKTGGARVDWVVDLSPPCQRAILERLKGVDALAYTRAKERNNGNGSAYPEGFTIDVRTGDVEGEDPKLPLKVRIDLTSDPKGMHNESVECWLDAVLDEHGKLSFGEFHMGRREGLRNTWAS